MQTTGTSPYAVFFVFLGTSTSAGGAAVLVAKLQAAVTTSSFPNTLTAWAPTWGYATAAAWTQAGLGSPVTTSNVAIALAASYSPVPAAQPQQLNSDQQLGLGLGIGLSLAAIVLIVAICACAMTSRFGARAATQFHVVALPASTAAK